MDLFIGNLPGNVVEKDLINFFRGYNKKVQFRIESKDMSDGSKLRYAVASYESDKLARKAMAKLHGQMLYGATLNIREFEHRSYNNERRAIGWRNKPWDDIERRQDDRRNHVAFQHKDEFDIILEGAPKEQQANHENLVVRAYKNASRKF